MYNNSHSTFTEEYSSNFTQRSQEATIHIHLVGNALDISYKWNHYSYQASGRVREKMENSAENFAK